MEESQIQHAKFIRQDIWKNHALKRTFRILPVFNISTFDICSTASDVRHAYWNSDSSLWFQSAMYPAANPGPPLLAGVAALICALGGLGQGAERRGAAAMAGGAPLPPLRPSRHPASPAPSWGPGDGGHGQGCGGASPPAPSPGRESRAVFLLCPCCIFIGMQLCRLGCAWDACVFYQPWSVLQLEVIWGGTSSLSICSQVWCLSAAVSLIFFHVASIKRWD